MATEHFCLRWNNHQSTLVSVFDNLLESGTLVDCTLAADGRYLKAHKVVLSACSPYLSMLLSQHYDKHPIIILKDVKFEELKAMLDYMYRGEVNISQEQLSTFLKAAESLQIKGLTDTGGDEGNGLQPNRPPSSNSTTSIPNEDPQSPGPPGDGGSSPSPRKRKRNKHSDEPPDNNSQVKLAANDGSEWSAREGGSVSGTPTNTGSPSAMKNANLGGVKREPTDVDGDGQMSVDESSDSTVLARPGPSNGSGTNNKGSPWILSADSTGEEMQLTPGQAGRRLCEVCGEMVTRNRHQHAIPVTETPPGSQNNSLPVLTPMDSQSGLPVLTPISSKLANQNILNIPLPVLTPMVDQMPVLIPSNNHLPVLTPINQTLPVLTPVNTELPVLTAMETMNPQLPVLTPMNDKLSPANNKLPTLTPIGDKLPNVCTTNSKLPKLTTIYR